jgi:hypothetical protein
MQSVEIAAVVKDWVIAAMPAVNVKQVAKASSADPRSTPAIR